MVAVSIQQPGILLLMAMNKIDTLMSNVLLGGPLLCGT